MTVSKRSFRTSGKDLTDARRSKRCKTEFEMSKPAVTSPQKRRIRGAALESILSAHARFAETFGREGKIANFENIDLRNVDFRGKELDSAHFTNCDLDGANFVGARLDRVWFQGCDLRNVKGISVTALSKQRVGLGYTTQVSKKVARAYRKSGVGGAIFFPNRGP